MAHNNFEHIVVKVQRWRSCFVGMHPDLARWRRLLNCYQNSSHRRLEELEH